MTDAALLSEIALRLKRAERILLLCHRRPDGDTLGSALALAEVLTQTGKTAAVLCADPKPERLACIEGEVLTEPPAWTPDCVVSVDIADLPLLGSLREGYENKIDVKIDHHVISPAFAGLTYVDETAAATGEIAARLIALLWDKPMPEWSRAVLNNLYAALLTDTGAFRYSNTTPATLRTAADLMDAGADAVSLCDALFASRGVGEIRATGALYERLRFYENGTVALMMFSADLMRERGISEEDIGAVTSLPREIRGVHLGLVLRQDPGDPGKFKLSARSADPIDVCALCEKLGGGGHIRAAGAEFRAASPEDAEKTVLLAAGIRP